MRLPGSSVCTAVIIAISVTHDVLRIPAAQAQRTQLVTKPLKEPPVVSGSLAGQQTETEGDDVVSKKSMNSDQLRIRAWCRAECAVNKNRFTLIENTSIFVCAKQSQTPTIVQGNQVTTIIPGDSPFACYGDVLQTSGNRWEGLLPPPAQSVLQGRKRGHIVSVRKRLVSSHLAVCSTYRRTRVSVYNIQHVAYHFPAHNGRVTWTVGVACWFTQDTNVRRIRGYCKHVGVHKCAAGVLNTAPVHACCARTVPRKQVSFVR